MPSYAKPRILGAMGSLFGVLLFVSATAVADTPAPSETAPPTVAPQAATSMTEDIEATLRPISFESSVRPSAHRSTSDAPRDDLRNPFARRSQLSRPRTPSPPPSPQANLADLKNPFSGRKARSKDSATPSFAPDLRDPFRRSKTPTPSVPPCPDTGGVPIQRPSKVRPRCVQAARYQALALR